MTEKKSTLKNSLPKIWVGESLNSMFSKLLLPNVDLVLIVELEYDSLYL